MYFFTPLPGYFSPFPHGTSPLSVTREYLGLGGGPPRFTRNFTGSVLLGIPLGRYGRFRLRDSYPLWCAFPCASTNAVLCYSLPDRQIRLNGPTTPTTQRLPAITRNGFSLFRFRSPLLTESRLLSLPVGNEMFHFPTFPPLALCVQARVTGHDSCRVSPFGHPRITARLAAPLGLIAASYVLHRLLVPRHPPCALTNLATKMLASTVQFSRNGRASVVLTACPGTDSCSVPAWFGATGPSRHNDPSDPRQKFRQVSFGPYVSGLELISQPVAWRQVPSGPNSVLGVLVFAASFH